MTATLDESRLRHPKERPVFIATVLLNLALIAGALALGLYGGDWLERHPRVAKFADASTAPVSLLQFTQTAPVEQEDVTSVTLTVQRSGEG